jgi:PAS domain S-box-containing protein
MTSDLAFELAPVGLAELALDGRFTRCNARLCAMLGLDRDTLLTHTLDDLAFIGETAAADASFADLRSGVTETSTWDQRLRCANGASRWIQIALSRVAGSDSAPSHFVGAFADATERVQLAESERNARARNAAMLGSALDCVISIDHHGRILEFNDAAERTFGHHRADVLGLPIAEVIIPPALRDAHRAGLARYLATGDAKVLGQRLELPAIRSDGTEFPVELAITRVPLPGDPIFTAYLRDLTERRAREARERILIEASKLLGSSLDYEKTLRALTNVVLPALADWYVVDLLENGALKRLLVSHRDPQKMQLAENLRQRYPSPTSSSRGAAHVILTGQTEHAPEIDPELFSAAARDAEHLRLMLELGLVSYMIVPMGTSEGIVGAITFVSAESNRRYVTEDVTLAEELARRAGHAIDNARLFARVEEARMLLEQQSIEMEEQASELESSSEELEHTNEELRATIEQLERRTEEAHSANRAKSDFLASMSHELRTPLNAVFGYVQLMSDGIRGPVTPAQLSDLDRIRRSAQHLLGLINDILNFAKLESGHVRYQVTDVRLNEVLDGVGDLVGPQLRARQLRYAYEPSDGAITVRADPDKIVQVMLNLLSNAIKFTEPGGEVRVSWTADDARVSIMVRDTGRGIADAELESIFEPFVQVGRERGQLAHGTGLGLAISRELARAMNGDLSVTSTPGKGSTFTFMLPRS